jgi:hypothetical protein
MISFSVCLYIDTLFSNDLIKVHSDDVTLTQLPPYKSTIFKYSHNQQNQGLGLQHINFARIQFSP